MTEFETNYLAHHGITGQVTNVTFSAIDVDTTDFLEHYQIKGAKHGIRRFQNFDGTLTDAGRARYGIGPAREKKTGDAGNSATSKKKTSLKEAWAKHKEANAMRKAKSEADARKLLKKYVRKHPAHLPALAKKLSQDEVNEIIKQIEFDRKLQSIRDDEIQRGWKRVSNLATRLGTLSTLLNNGKNLYNNTAEIYNSMIDSGAISAEKKMFKVGDSKKEDRSDIEKIVRSGTAQQVYDSRDKMTSKELQDAVSRLNYEEQMRNKYGVK